MSDGGPMTKDGRQIPMTEARVSYGGSLVLAESGPSPAPALGRRMVSISARLLKQLLTQGNELRVLVEEGLPPDAELVNVTYEYFRDQYCLIFQSAAWERVEPGHILDQQNIVYRQLEDADACR